MPPLQNNVKITSNQKLQIKGYHLLSLSCPTIFKDAQPGQFVHIKINPGVDPLLRRPLSIYRVKKEPKQKGISVEILYEVVGKGTALLSQKEANDVVDIIGPLGNGFNCQDVLRNTIPIIVAGGMGVAPLSFLADRVVATIPKKSSIEPVILIGAKTKKKVISEDNFRKLNCSVKIATEDGSNGFKGKVTDLFKREIRRIYAQREKISKNKKITKRNDTADQLKSCVMVYACGPIAMLTELAKICKIEHVSLQVSLEEFMGCGIGACLGCAIETKSGYKRVCKDGPVFCAKDIKWQF